MAGRVYLAIPYVAPRCAIWALLFVVALWDGIRHRAVRSRGFQLYWVSAGSIEARLAAPGGALNAVSQQAAVGGQRRPG